MIPKKYQEDEDDAVASKLRALLPHEARVAFDFALEHGAELNPFIGSHYAWLDLHLASVPHAHFDEVARRLRSNGWTIPGDNKLFATWRFVR